MRRLALALALALVPARAWAAYVHVQTVKQSPTAATTATSVASIAETFGTTPVVGHLVVVFVSAFGSAAADPGPLTVADNQGGGNTYQVIPSPLINSAIRAWIVWSITSVASGTFTVTATFSHTATGAAIGISEFSGAASSPADGSTTNSGTSTAPDSGSLTPSQSGDLFVSAVTDTSGVTQTYTIPSGWDGKRAEQPSGVVQTLSSASKIKTDSLAEDPLWSDSPSTTWTTVTAAFKAGGPAVPLTPTIKSFTIKH